MKKFKGCLSIKPLKSKMNVQFRNVKKIPEFVFQEKLKEDDSLKVYVCFTKANFYYPQDGFVILRILSTEINDNDKEMRNKFLREIEYSWDCSDFPFYSKPLLSGEQIKDKKIQTFLILELYPFSDLNHYYRNLYYFQDAPSKFEQFKFIYLICQSLENLHSKDIIHRDLKPANIFITDNLIPIIGDFGYITKSYSIKSGRFGTAGYIAPEILNFGDNSKESDIFSLGATLFFIIYGVPIYFFNKSENNINSLIKKSSVTQNLTDILNNHSASYISITESQLDFIRYFLESNKFYDNLIKECLKTNPSERPSIGDLNIILTSYGERIFPTEFESLKELKLSKINQKTINGSLEHILNIDTNFTYYLRGIYYYHLFNSQKKEVYKEKAFEFLQKSIEAGCFFVSLTTFKTNLPFNCNSNIYQDKSIKFFNNFKKKIF